VHLLVAPFLVRIVLVEADEIAVVALIQRLIADDLEIFLASSSRMRSSVRWAR